jgi:tetratricopeptide (TPR) repeat protein
LYQKAQRFPDAEKEYNAALQLDPKSSELLMNLGSLYIQLAEQAQAKRDAQAFPTALDAAVRALNQAVQIQPNSAKAYSLLGTVYYTGGQFPRAEENLMHALQLEKGMGQAELVLANVYIKQKKWKEALEYLDTYLKDNPKASDRDQVQQTRAKVAAQK